jgi:hypothetical protein
MGINGVAISVQGATRNEWCDNVERTGQEIIAKI